MGFGMLALSSLLAEGNVKAGEESPSFGQPHHKPTAKNIIFLFMAGGPSHIDTFDPKPTLDKLDGQETPESIAKLFKRTATMGNGTRKLMASPFKFKPHGESGLPVSSLLPAMAEHIDDLCVIRSIQHDTVIHMPGEYMLTTGTIVGDRPSLGSWVSYGLGSENEDLPAFIVLGDTPRPAYASGFLPPRYEGTLIADAQAGISNLALPPSVKRSDRRKQLDLIRSLNEQHLQSLGEAAAELEARIKSYELAFWMQMEAPEAFNLREETEATRRLYGIGQSVSTPVGTQCLLARRLVERGVRFVQVRVDGWDSHSDLKGGHESCAARSDVSIAGLLSDLKRSGLLDSTLVVWGGEFGRTPGAEKGNGRDHSPGGFTMWMAGGGVMGGQVIGTTDEVGYTAIERPIHPNSLHATMLHALGIHQEKIFFTHHGRQEIPTFVKSEVVNEVFA
jgi:hypothetical protein